MKSFFKSSIHQPFEFLEYYKNIQKDAFSGSRPKNFVCFQPNEAGFGNKLYGMISTLFIAMATKRGFAICDWPVVFDYFQFPFPVPLFKSSDLTDMGIYHFGPYCTRFPTLRIYSLSTLFPEDSIVIRTNCMLIPAMMTNPYIHKVRQYMGFREENISHDDLKLYIHSFYMNKVILLSTTLEKQVLSIYDSFPKAIYLGLQLRTGNDTDFFSRSKKTFLNDNIINNLIRNITDRTKELENKHQMVRWFVVSDSSRLKIQMKKRFPQYVTLYHSKIDHPGYDSIYNVTQGAKDALIEMYLLSKCDTIFMTPKSTFGALSRCIRGKGFI
ncbi:hypothetical protein WA158_003874 [Blastocystis sp. Blastoise]